MQKGFGWVVMTKSFSCLLLKRATLNIRIKPELRGLIDRAAELAGKNRTDFVVDAACVAGANSLLDQVPYLW